MPKITIEIEDIDGKASLNATVLGYDPESPACQIADRILGFVDQIADRAEAEQENQAQKSALILPGHKAIRGSDMKKLATEIVRVH